MIYGNMYIQFNSESEPNFKAIVGAISQQLSTKMGINSWLEKILCSFYHTLI